MKSEHDEMRIAVDHHRAGRWSEAEAIYRRTIQSHPRHSQAYYLLGVLASQTGHDATAIELLRTALEIEPALLAARVYLGLLFLQHARPVEAVAELEKATWLQPDNPDLRNRLGNAFRAQGNLPAAEACYRYALALDPAKAEIHSNLGLVLHEQGMPQAAVDAYRQALERCPELAQTHFNLGNALKELKQFDDAIDSYRRALVFAPASAETCNSLGATLQQLDRIDEALAAYDHALELSPEHALAHYNRGHALLKLDRAAEAILAFQRSIDIDPTRCDAYNNLGNALESLGKWDEAAAAYRAALQRNPDFAKAHYNLGLVQTALGDLEAAVASYQKAIQLDPEFSDAYFNLGCVLQELGQYELAVQACRHALRGNDQLSAVSLTHLLQQMCDWQELAELSMRLIQRVDQDDEANLRYPVEPLAFLGIPVETTASQQLKCAQQWARHKKLNANTLAFGDHQRLSLHDKPRIRLGYLSADFRNHPVAYLTAELFEQHDRARFDVIGYSMGDDDSGSMRRRIASSFDLFRDIHACSYDEAARRIAADGIDILIDLQGYTLHSRPQILSLRPAPIQINYLGYPGSMGTSCVDYILVDDYIVPADQQPYYTERLIHLPGCYMVNDRTRKGAQRTPTRSELGLPEEAFVFCAFSTSYKISEEMFNVWLRLLRCVPQSVLWLKDHRCSNANLQRYAERQAVSPSRLIFAPTIAMDEHLARHRAADLFLDTFPYNQHSTASDALRMGLPVVTRSGQTFASRVAGSLLTAVGMPELIAHRMDEYESLARRLAQHPSQLQQIKSQLANNLQNCSLYDGQAFARKVEKVYESMIHCESRRP